MKNEIIGVIGAGVMGGGIAQMFAENGFQTLIWDACEEFTARGYDNIRKRLNKSVEKGKLPAHEAEAVIGRIKPVTALEELATSALIIEAVIEDFEAKKQLFARLEKILSPHAAIGTNTSSLSVTELAQTLSRPERFMGIHFFNPPTKLALVELIAIPGVDSDILQKVEAILSACGKTAVKVKDSPGFIVNRLLLPFINEAAKLVSEGVAGVEDIDTAMCLGALHPAGPLQVADLIGLDVCSNILETLSKSLDDQFYKPAKAMVDLVESGKLGRKTGQGFYKY
ncbi:MAG: 3-hydroxyacyl-CoA dehydrogenase family protein [Lentisphaerota bacterium]